MKVDPRAERAVVWVAAVGIALPILFFRYPPMSDLPHHEGIVGILRHFDDPAFIPPGLYVRNLGHGNQLFHVLVLLLSYLMPIDWAAKLVVAATVVTNVVVTGRLAAYLGASRWVALLATPAVVGWLFLMGFAHDLIGLAMLQAALPALDRYCERPTLRGGLEVAAFTVALHFGHESGMVVFSGASLVFAAGHRLELRGTLLRVAPFFLALAIAVGDLLVMKHLRSVSVDVVPRVYIPLGRKLQTIPVILFGRHEPWLLYPLFAMCAVAVVWLAVERARGEAGARTPGQPRRPPLHEVVHRYRLELFAAAAFAGYLVFPSTLNGAALVYQRFLAPAYILAAVSLAPRRDAFMGAVPRMLACLAPILALAALWPVFEDSSAVARELDRVFPLVHEGSAIALVDLDPIDPARVYMPSGASARVLAMRGGRLLPTFTESPNAAVMTNPTVRWDEPMLRLLLGARGFVPGHDFHRFRYAIVHTKYDGNAALAVAAIAPYARLVVASGEWLLFESAVDVAPVASPDAPMEDPRPPTLVQRMNELLSTWKKEQGPAPSLPPGADGG